MLLKYLYNKKKIHLFKFENILLVFWIGCLLSINSKISDLYITDQNPLAVFLISIRIAIPVLVFLILIFFLKIKKLNLFNLSYLSFALWQLIILSTNKVSSIAELEKYHLIISMIAILLIIHVVKYSKFKFLESKLLIFSTLFIASISFYYSILTIIEFIKSRETFYLYWNAATMAEGRNLLQTNPRITGISRMLGLVLFFIFSIFICNKKKINNLILIALMFIISFLLYGMQSKGSYLSILILIIYYIFFFKEEIKKKIFISFIILVLPILAYEAVIKIKVYSINKVEFKKIGETYVNSRFFSKNNVVINGEIQSDYTTGRYEIWSRALKIIKEKRIFLGYGPQADRMLLGTEIMNSYIPGHFFDSNASNGLIYSYLCAGIIGLLFILIIYLLIFLEIYKSIFVKKAFTKKKTNIIFSILTLTFLTLRTFYENGYALFGIDFIFTTLAYFILQKFNLRSKL
jgi:O-antigen ligase